MLSFFYSYDKFAVFIYDFDFLNVLNLKSLNIKCSEYATKMTTINENPKLGKVFFTDPINLSEDQLS